MSTIEDVLNWALILVIVLGSGAAFVVTWLRPTTASERLLRAIPGADSESEVRLHELRRQTRLEFRRQTQHIVLLWAVLAGFSGIVAALQAYLRHDAE